MNLTEMTEQVFGGRVSKDGWVEQPARAGAPHRYDRMKGMTRMVASRYTRVAMLLHWLIALCLLCQFLLGWYLEGIPRGVPDRSYFVNIHKSTGILIGLLILLRIVWRITHTPPPLPDSIPTWQQKAASCMHFLLYFFMLLLPLTGYIASNFSKWGVKFFNTIEMPPWGVEDKSIYAFFNQAHGLISWILLGLVILHVLAAVSHMISGRREIIHRMLPGSSSDRQHPSSS